MSNYTLVAKVNTGYSYDELFAVKADGTMFHGFKYGDKTRWHRLDEKVKYEIDAFSYIGVSVSKHFNFLK